MRSFLKNLFHDQKMFEDLKAERDYTAQIIQGTPSLVVGINPDGTTRFVNPAIENLTGYKKEELIGKNWWATFYPGEEYAQVERLFKDFEKGAVRDYAMTLTTKDGGKKIVAWNSLNRFSSSGTLIEVIGFGNDITARTHAEKELKAQQAIAASSMKMSALGEMAAGIAHEVNSPLAIISTLAGQLKDMIEDDELDTVTLKETAQTIEATTFRISKIINALKTFSRNADGDVFTRVSVSSIISDTLVLCQQKLKHLQINLEVPNTSDSIKVDCQAIQISQVLLNLLNNSVDAVATESEKWIRIEVKELDDEVEISVTDSGLGIATDTAEKIMQPFFTTKEIGKGTGLGLSISKGIVEIHKGRLLLDTTSRNTRFAVILPKNQAAQAKQAA
ncbi:MAG: ATP-binding protein [Bdellovibrionales bacterium]